MRTLKVTVGERDRLNQRTRSRIKAAQEGEDLDDSQPVLNFGSYAELSRLLSPKNLELLETISKHQPESIREAADLVERDYKQVHRNLSELEDIGVIEFKRADLVRQRNRNWPTMVLKSTSRLQDRTGVSVQRHPERSCSWISENRSPHSLFSLHVVDDDRDHTNRPACACTLWG